MSTAEHMWTVPELAEDWRLDRFTILRLCRAGKLRSRNTGRRYLIPDSAVREYQQGRDEPLRATD